MKRGTTIFLKLSVILIGIPILVMCIFVVPEIAKYASDLLPGIPVINTFVLLFMYLPALPFYFALYQAFKLLSHIDKNQAFSDLSVHSLKLIKFSAGIISICYVFFMPLLYMIAEAGDAPGFIAIGMVIIFAAMVIAVFAAVLQRLLQEAIRIKSENDLTV
ncbi:DUF2975 domain-containing protein [Halobacillus litoralis]|uniref:DUF2975 domain-containing protein n=1 Tax=Halobacillus litoralis TaxID=45668 RepID=UPI001CFF0C13|nr:DUF2975 domain-containing protein [Halobacillus litoralis]